MQKMLFFGVLCRFLLLYLIIRFKFVVSLMCMAFCLIIKCILELIFMQFYTCPGDRNVTLLVEWLL